MSVPEGKRTRNKMDMLAATQKLAEYTVGICSNEKKFWSRDIASDIAAMAWRAHSLLTRANAVNVRPGCDPANYVERRSLQDRGLSELNALKQQIECAGKAFRRDKRKTAYWMGLCVDAIDLSTRWRDSEARKWPLSKGIG